MCHTEGCVKMGTRDIDGDKCDYCLSIATLERLIVEICLDVWQLSRAIERLRTQNAAIPDEITSAVRRLEQDIEAGGLKIDDPIGETYEHGMRMDVVQVMPGDEGERRVIRTVRPGVRLGGRILRPASVVVGRSNAQ
jgi:molecular chaperone GrpE (heat shock protein)